MGKESSACNAEDSGRHDEFSSPVGKIPWRRPVFLPGESHFSGGASVMENSITAELGAGVAGGSLPRMVWEGLSDNVASELEAVRMKEHSV